MTEQEIRDTSAKVQTEVAAVMLDNDMDKHGPAIVQGALELITNFFVDIHKIAAASADQ